MERKKKQDPTPYKKVKYHLNTKNIFLTKQKRLNKTIHENILYKNPMRITKPKMQR